MFFILISEMREPRDAMKVCKAPFVVDTVMINRF